MLSAIKKLLTWFFVFLGVVFFVLLSAAAYLWFADPWGVRAWWEMRGTAGPAAAPAAEDASPLLSPAQEEALSRAGIDPASLPQEISPELEDCLVAAVGEVRAEEIRQGAAPTFGEVLKAKECL